MNLLETIKHYNIKFPENAKYAVQDKDGEIKFALSDSIKFIDCCGIWIRADVDYNGVQCAYGEYPLAAYGEYPLATDYDTAIIANPNQQAK